MNTDFYFFLLSAKTILLTNQRMREHERGRETHRTRSINGAFHTTHLLIYKPGYDSLPIKKITATTFNQITERNQIKFCTL